MVLEAPNRPGAGDALRRMERSALLFTGAAVALALVVPGDRLRTVGGVLGGALLAGVSYWAIKHGVSGLADAILRGSRPRALRGVLLVTGRYALLAGIAYVMMARLRLHPLALLGGASIIPLAAVVEALRQRP
jgi:hypothetical protein